MNNIKDYRNKELKLYMIANILIILATSENISYNEITGNVYYIKKIVELLNISLISGFMSIITFLLDSLYSSNIKSKLLNLFDIIPEPGERIFSNIFNNNYKDHRIDINDALIEYNDIKVCMERLTKKEKNIFENTQWYKIYHKYRNQDMIFISNKDYLLCRDIYIATINIIILYLLFSKIFKIINFSNIYFISILILAVVSNISAHGKSKRKVYNVIAYDLSEKLRHKIHN